MDTSNLRSQFPLSPRKFWKKIIAQFFHVLYFVVFFTVALYIIIRIEIPELVDIIYLIPIILLVLIEGIYAWYVSVYIKTYHYSDDQNFLTIRKGVFMPKEIHVQYLKMQDVNVDQDILDRILGIYDVHIASATQYSGIEAHIDGVEKAAADGLKQLLLDKIQNATNGTKAVSKTDIVTTTTTSVNFSNPISLATYGLSRDWWKSEIIKMTIANVFVSLVITFLIGTQMERETDGSIYFTGLFPLWLGVFAFAIIGNATSLWLWKQHYNYEFGPEYIKLKEGIISLSEQNMAYSTIQGVRMNQNLIDRIFGVANLVIDNASPGSLDSIRQGSHAQMMTTGIVIKGLSLSDAQKIADQLKEIIIKKARITNGL